MPNIMREGKWRAEELLKLCIQHEAKIARLRAALEEVGHIAEQTAEEALPRLNIIYWCIRKALADEQPTTKQTYVSSTPNPLTGLPDTYER